MTVSGVRGEDGQGRCPICLDVRHVAATPEECTALWLAYRTDRRHASPELADEYPESVHKAIAYLASRGVDGPMFVALLKSRSPS